MNFGKYALLALAGAGLLTFASCGKDEKKAAPVIKVMHGTTELKGTLKEADFPILVVATPADDVKELGFMVTYTQEGQTGEQKSQKISGKKESLGYTGTIKKEDLPTGIKKGTIIISAKGSDATGKLEVNYDFNADNGGGNGGGNDTPAKTWGEVKNGFLNHKATDGATAAWDLKTGEALKIKENKNTPEKLYMMNISTGHAEDATKAVFSSTFTSDVAKFSTEPKTVKGNGCMFVNVKSGLNFETATVAEVEAKATGMSTTVENPVENDVIIAKYNDELYLIKVTEISKTATATRKGQGCMKFQYKAKK